MNTKPEQIEYVGGPLDGQINPASLKKALPNIGSPFAVDRSGILGSTRRGSAMYERTGQRTNSGNIILQFVGYKE